MLGSIIRHTNTVSCTNNCPCAPTMSPISTHFGCLDELAQVIYQSMYRFVVLSSVTVDEWIIHVGLADSQGRWWKGRWSQDDVERILVKLYRYVTLCSLVQLNARDQKQGRNFLNPLQRNCGSHSYAVTSTSGIGNGTRDQTLT